MRGGGGRPLRVGVFGGTFDPFHRGHLMVVRAARSMLRLDVVVVVLTGVPPHRREPRLRPKAPARHRLAMARLACRRARVGGVAVSTFELTGRPAYAVDTMRWCRRRWPRAELWYVMGADAAPAFSSWRSWRRIASLCRLAVVRRDSVTVRRARGALKRLGLRESEAFQMLPTPMVNVRATVVRSRAADGRSLRGLVPPEVARYIRAHGLYRA